MIVGVIPQERPEGPRVSGSAIRCTSAGFQRSYGRSRQALRACGMTLLMLVGPSCIASAQRPPSRELTVRVLDDGQGDAILIQNGGSTVLVDGGPDPRVLGRYLDALMLNGDTVDAVILTHQHADHYQGLRELFASRRHIVVRFFWENQDPSPNVTLARLRDSIASRVRAGSLVYRDTDDPCATGQAICTVTLRGGALLHIMRPDPKGRGANNRSVAVKLVGPDSASFTMWMAGDAEHQAIQWFDRSI